MRRKVGVAETSGLKGHLRTCAATLKQTQLLDQYGITGGNSATMSKREVRENFALWTAASARPFCIVKDKYVSFSSSPPLSILMILMKLLKLLHPDARTHRPHRDTISQDVIRIYKAMQKELKATLFVRAIVPLAETNEIHQLI
jgi:hypothetical protein